MRVEKLVGDWNLQDWKMTDEVAGVEFAGPWKMKDWKMTD